MTQISWELYFCNKNYFEKISQVQVKAKEKHVSRPSFRNNWRRKDFSFLLENSSVFKAIFGAVSVLIKLQNMEEILRLFYSYTSGRPL